MSNQATQAVRDIRERVKELVDDPAKMPPDLRVIIDSLVQDGPLFGGETTQRMVAVYCQVIEGLPCQDEELSIAEMEKDVPGIVGWFKEVYGAIKLSRLWGKVARPQGESCVQHMAGLPGATAMVMRVLQGISSEKPSQNGFYTVASMDLSLLAMAALAGLEAVEDYRKAGRPSHTQMASDLNFLLSMLRKDVEIIGAHYLKHGNDAPGQLLRDKIESLQKYLDAR